MYHRKIGTNHTWNLSWLHLINAGMSKTLEEQLETIETGKSILWDAVQAEEQRWMDGGAQTVS